MRTLVLMLAAVALAAVACGDPQAERHERMMATARAVWTVTAQAAPTATAKAEAKATAEAETNEAAELFADVVLEGRWRAIAAESLRIALEAIADHQTYGTSLLQACDALELMQESWRPRLPELAAIYDELVVLTDQCYWTAALEGPQAVAAVERLAADVRALLSTVGQDQ